MGHLATGISVCERVELKLRIIAECFASLVSALVIHECMFGRRQKPNLTFSYPITGNMH